MEQVDLWFDPMCPWTWITSRWLVEVERVRPVKVVYHVLSLAVLNEGREGLDPDYRKRMETVAWYGARACIGVEQRYGQSGLHGFYTRLGTRFHPQGEPVDPETVRAALADLCFDTGIADDCTTDKYDEALRASHQQGISLVGSDVGAPIIAIGGSAIFGPVLSPAPAGEAAGQLFDGVRAVLAYPGFYELKRTRGVGPVFG